MIKRITKIDNFGIFKDYRRPSGGVLPDFKKKNIIYGWNGTGKSTLATLFGLLEKKGSENKYTDSPAFEIELDDESKLTQNNLENAPLVRLFDEDFVSDNIDWRGKKTKPIFFVGADNLKLSNELSEKKKLSKTLEKDTDNKLEEKKKKGNQFLKWKKILANRTIKDSLNTGAGDKYANYDTAKLQNTMENTPDIDTRPFLSKNEKSILNKKIQQSSLLEIAKLDLPSGIQVLINDTNLVLKKTAISKILDRLKKNKEAENWVDEGLKLHKENNYKECQFCGRDLTKDILHELEDHFNDEYQTLSKEIKYQKTKLEESISSLEIIEKDFDLELRTRFKEIKYLMDKANEAFNYILRELTEKIKYKTPNEKIEEYYIDKKDQKYLDANNLFESIKDLNSLIKKHNEKVKNFDQEILNAKKKIELSIIVENIKEYRGFEIIINLLAQEEKALRTKLIQVRTRITEIEGKLLDAAKAVVHINKYLKDYFGRDEIQVEFNEKEMGFNILRNKKRGSNLSEGERTGIAFIYFLTKLEEKNFNKSNCIVIIDDPVSSLDSNSLYFAFAFLKEKLRDVHQLFIFTHTFDFLRQVKNWFYQIQRNEGMNKADYFMTDCYWESNVRKSKLKPLDKLLTDYQSEYHYLLKLLIDLVNDNEPELEKVYNFPNITRKFLEVFLSFKYPHKHKLYHKMQELVNQKYIDEHTQIGISLFINELSHDFKEDSTESFNMSHLFSANQVAEKVIDIVKIMEPEQYKMLIQN